MEMMIRIGKKDNVMVMREPNAKFGLGNQIQKRNCYI